MSLSTHYLVTDISAVPVQDSSSGRGIRCTVNSALVNLGASTPSGKVDLKYIKHSYFKIRDVNEFKNITFTKKLSRSEILKLILDEFELNNNTLTGNTTVSFVVPLSVSDLPNGENGSEYAVEHIETNIYDIENKQPITCKLEKSGAPSAPILNSRTLVEHESVSYPNVTTKDYHFVTVNNVTTYSVSYQESLLSLVNHYHDYTITKISGIVTDSFNVDILNSSDSTASLGEGDYITITGTDVNNWISGYCPGENYRVQDVTKDGTGKVTSFKLAIADDAFIRNSHPPILRTNVSNVTGLTRPSGTPAELTGTVGGLTFRVSRIGPAFNLHKASLNKMRSHKGRVLVAFTESDGGSDLKQILVTAYFTLSDPAEYVSSMLQNRARPRVKSATRTYTIEEVDLNNRSKEVALPLVIADKDTSVVYEAEVINATNNNSLPSNCVKVFNDVRVNFTQNQNALSGASVDQTNAITVSTTPQFYNQSLLGPTDNVYVSVAARKTGETGDFTFTDSINNAVRDTSNPTRDLLFNTSRTFTFQNFKRIKPGRDSVAAKINAKSTVPAAGAVPAYTEIQLKINTVAAGLTAEEKKDNYFKGMTISRGTGLYNSSTQTPLMTITASSTSTTSGFTTITYRYNTPTDDTYGDATGANAAAIDADVAFKLNPLLYDDPIEAYTVYDVIIVLTKVQWSITTNGVNVDGSTAVTNGLTTVPGYKVAGNLMVSQSINSNIVRGIAFLGLTESQRGQFTGGITVTKFTTGTNAGSLVVGGLGYTGQSAFTPALQVASLSYIRNNVKTLVSPNSQMVLSITATGASVAEFSNLNANSRILVIPKHIVDTSDVNTSFEISVSELRLLKDTLYNSLSGNPELLNSPNVVELGGVYYQKFTSPSVRSFSKPVDPSIIGKPSSAILNAIRGADGVDISLGLTLNNVIPTADKTVVLASMTVELSDSESFDDSSVSNATNVDGYFLSTSRTVNGSKVLIVPIVANDPAEFLRLYVMTGVNQTLKDIDPCVPLFARVRYFATQLGYSNNTPSSEYIVTPSLVIGTGVNSVSNFAVFTTINDGVRSINGSHTLPTIIPTGFAYLSTRFRVTNNVGNDVVEPLVIANASNSPTVSFKVNLPDGIISGTFTVTAVAIYRNFIAGSIVEAGAVGQAVSFLTPVRVINTTIRSSANNFANEVSGKALNNQTNLKMVVTISEDSQNNVASVYVALPNGSITDPQCLVLSREGTSNKWSATFNAQVGADYTSVRPFAIAIGQAGAGFHTFPPLN
jgi:hypothetical protein